MSSSVVSVITLIISIPWIMAVVTSWVIIVTSAENDRSRYWVVRALYINNFSVCRLRLVLNSTVIRISIIMLVCTCTPWM